jgi:tetratricopeptide (TPR) repeat protein
MGKYMEAIVFFDKAIQLNPNDKLTYECKELSMEKFTKGLAECNELIDSSENKAIAYNNKGNLILSRKNFRAKIKFHSLTKEVFCKMPESMKTR